MKDNLTEKTPTKRDIIGYNEDGIPIAHRPGDGSRPNLVMEQNRKRKPARRKKRV